MNNNLNNNEKFHKDTFDKIPTEKRERIIRIARAEFAEKGLKGANVNIIAEKAGISIGSMYNYFATKEDIFLMIVEEGYRMIEKAYSNADLESGTIFDKIETIVNIAIRHSRENTEFIQLYHYLSSQVLSQYSNKLSRKLEYITKLYWEKQIEDAKKDGTVREDVDTKTASYCIDNIIVMVQYAYALEYYRERLSMFVGKEALEDEQLLIKGIIDFIKNSMGKKE